MSRRIADTVTVKEIEIAGLGHQRRTPQIQVGARPNVSDDRREQCAREVADAILDIFDEEIVDFVT